MLSSNRFIELPLNKLTQYVNGITGNTIIANKYEKLAVERFIAHKQKYIYKESEVRKALKFFSLLFILVQA